jgi:hypothetical protein
MELAGAQEWLSRKEAVSSKVKCQEMWIAMGVRIIVADVVLG